MNVTGAKLATKLLENARPAGKAQDKSEAGKTSGADVRHLFAGLKFRQSNRRIKIIKHRKRPILIENELARIQCVWTVGGNDGGIRVHYVGARFRPNGVPRRE